MLGVRDRPAAARSGKTAAAAVVAWFVVNLPIMLLFPRGWSEFFRLNARRGDDMDSLYNVVKSFTGWQGFDQNLGFWQTAGGAERRCRGAVRVVLRRQSRYIALTAPQRPRVAQLAFLVVAAFLLTNKVWSPQFSLWLVPLAVLALPHRRILLAWMTVDALVWVPRMLYLYGEQNKGLPEQWFTATVLLRDIAVVVLCVLVIRQIYRPELDLVRWNGRVDDPAGGVFDRAPDDPPRWLPDRLRPRTVQLAAPPTDHDYAEVGVASAADPGGIRSCSASGVSTATIGMSGPPSCSLGRLPTQATLLPRTVRGRYDHRR